MKVVKPKRITRRYTQTINASPEKVFPLLCPVRETEWVVGWNPELVISESGLAEKDCVFVTEKGKKKNYWVISKYDPVGYELEMFIISPGVTAAKLEIKLCGRENQTKAEIAYSYTSLGKKGDKFIKDFTEERYMEFMKIWEKELNYFFYNGSKIPDSF